VAFYQTTNLGVGSSSLSGRAIEGLRVPDPKAFAISGLTHANPTQREIPQTGIMVDSRP